MKPKHFNPTLLCGRAVWVNCMVAALLHFNLGFGAEAKAAVTKPDFAADLFVARIVPRLRIEIPPEGTRILENYIQIWGQPKPERIDVRATVREGNQVYTNVAIHLKGSGSFRPFNSKPSLTLNFEKLAPAQRFHGLKKIHVNNSVQDPSYLSEGLARDLFNATGVPAPRAGHALVNINGRDLGLYVLVEGANKDFLKRHFDSVDGNLYDADLGGDIHKTMKVSTGDRPGDRSELDALVEACREPDLALRATRMAALLDLDRFITLSAIECLTAHWDGYLMSPNNYRIFHDTARGKLVFMPQGLDMLFGYMKSTPTATIAPQLNGLVARSLFVIPEARQRWFDKMRALSTNEFQTEALLQRVDLLAAKIQPSLAGNLASLLRYGAGLEQFKQRIRARMTSVAEQLSQPERTLSFDATNTARLTGWQFKGSSERPSSGARRREGNQEILQVTARAPGSSGSWRTLVLLGQGRYEFTCVGKVTGLTSTPGAANGVILRVSGERGTGGISTNTTWQPLSYEFDVHGILNVELVAEFRGSSGFGSFAADSFRLLRKSRMPSGPNVPR